jgi:hypothetical protein
MVQRISHIPFLLWAFIFVGLPLDHSICTAAEQARYSLTLHTLGPDAAPLPNTTIWVVHDRKVYTGKSNGDGIWRLENLPSAPITLIAHKDTFSLAGSEGYLIQNETVNLQLRQPQDLILQTVTPRNIAIQGAVLRELRINDTFSVDYQLLTPHGLPGLYSDEEGTITIPYLPRYGYGGVTVSHRKYLDGILPTVPIGKPIPLVMLEGGKVRGRVTTPDGVGAAQAQVTLFRVRDMQNLIISETLTDPEGFYQISAPLKSFQIAVRHTDFSIPDPKSVTLSQTNPEVIINYGLLAPYHIAGTVVNQKGNPVPKTWVSYRSNQSTFNEALTNDRGEYTIVARKGNGQLNISPPAGYMTVKYPVIKLQLNEEEKNIDLNPIQLKPLPTISGRLTYQKKQPGVPIILQSLNTATPIWTTTNLDGRFSIQLDHMPDDQVIRWSAEHPLRFQRVSFETTLDGEEQDPFDLKSFRPDLKKDPSRSPNDLTHLLNKPAPPWECDEWFNLPNGMESLNLQDLDGKVIVILLWGHWGGFGQHSASEERVQEFNAYSAAYKNTDDVVFLGIHDASQEPFEVEQTIKNWNVQFPVGCDAGVSVSFDLYNVSVIPQTVIIDREGIVRYIECDGRVPELIKAVRRRP